MFLVYNRLHNNPKYWDHPEQFNPDRWNTIENVDSAPYRPFGFGSRACIGMRMSFIEAKVVRYLIVFDLVNHKCDS